MQHIFSKATYCNLSDIRLFPKAALRKSYNAGWRRKHSAVTPNRTIRIKLANEEETRNVKKARIFIKCFGTKRKLHFNKIKKSQKRSELPSSTVQKKQNTSVVIIENHIKIRCQMKIWYDTLNARIRFMKNAPTQVLIMLVFIATPMTTCKDIVVFMYM